MDRAVSVLAVSLAAAGGMLIGVLLGAWLGRVGAFAFFHEILKLPWMLLRSPVQLVNRWKTFGEWRARQKIARIRFRNQMSELRGKIAAYRSEIRKTRAEIRRTRWKFREPEPPGE